MTRLSGLAPSSPRLQSLAPPSETAAAGGAGGELHRYVARQVAHWVQAAARLEDLEASAAPDAWDSLEHYMGVALRRNLGEALERLQRDARSLSTQFELAAAGGPTLEAVAAHVVAFRNRYLRTETLVDFYGQAVNTRTNPELAAMLRACDVMATRSMAQLLEPMGRAVPPVLTYIDQGLGASILKAGLRLWDGGTLSAVAAVKIARHNLFRPTALIHEAGHQVAHILNWNQDLAAALDAAVRAAVPSGGAARDLAHMWGGWASEIAADTFAFVHTGYAAVAALCDVLAGDDAFVFRHTTGDPHPVGYVRVLLGAAMCRQSFGRGPWDDLAAVWSRRHPLEPDPGDFRARLAASLPLLPRISEVCLRAPLRAFGGRPISAVIDPARVAPAALAELERRAGPALHTSQHWVTTECLRLLALSGLRVATHPERAMGILKQQERWMARLGAAVGPTGDPSPTEPKE